MHAFLMLLHDDAFLMLRLCRYLLRVTVTGKGMVADTKKDFPFWVRNYDVPADAAPPIKMEVGIEDCLHIEFEYDKAKYHLKDVVVGKIYFLLVRIKLKHMEVEIRRRETTGVTTVGLWHLLQACE